MRVPSKGSRRGFQVKARLRKALKFKQAFSRGSEFQKQILNEGSKRYQKAPSSKYWFQEVPRFQVDFGRLQGF